jgi:hypothetical protein
MKTALLSLALVFLPLSLAAPSGPPADCPANPCTDYNALLEYCAENYNEAVIEADRLGAKAIDCMCGHLGVEGVTKRENTVAEGWPAVIVCAACTRATGFTKDLIYAWGLTCNTWHQNGVEAALLCWNLGEDCDTNV